MEVFGSEEATTEWIESPSHLLIRFDKTGRRPNSLGSLEHNVVCLGPGCVCMFVTVNEMKHNSKSNKIFGIRP